jgi:hypothetical protein
MRAYLTAHAGKQHEKHFGWKTFRVLTVTTDHHRMQSMMDALRRLRIPHSPGAPLFCAPPIRLPMSGATATAALFGSINHFGGERMTLPSIVSVFQS